MALPRLAIRRPVATTMVYLILVVLGVVSLRSLPVDLLPKIELTQLTVRVSYPNVAPEEIEQLLTEPLENALSGLPNLQRMSSRSEEGSVRIRLDLARGTDLDEAANDARAALDRIRDDLPTEADQPEVSKLDLDAVEVVSLAATSTRPLDELTRLIEDDLARRFRQLPGVGAITVRGGISRQVRVELDRDRLQALGLTALDVEAAIERGNLALPGGHVQRGLADLSVRPLAEYRSIDEIAATEVARVGPVPVKVRDLGAVRDDYEDVRILSELNGVPSVGIGIQKQSGANTVAVAAAIRREVERIHAERRDVRLTLVSDQSELIRQSIASVRSSALWGSLLAVLVLYGFLRRRSSTAIVALSIPISVISAFGLLYFAGLTLNQMTFGGLALGVGMIVDNAIVVLESIVRKREEEGAAPAAAARVGAGEVTGAIVASTLTTCVIFLPVVFTRTTSGALFQALALVVVFSLACSLFVALTLVPMLAARLPSRRKAGDQRPRRGGLERLENLYSERLKGAIRRRGRVFAFAAILLVAALLAFPLIPVELAPQVDADEIDVEIEMAEGTNIAVVRSYVEELEALVRAALPEGAVRVVSTEVRGTDAEVELTLVPADRRSTSSAEIADRLRAAVDGRIPGAEIEVDAQPGLWILRRIFSSGAGDRPIQIELRDWDLERAAGLAAEVRRRVAAVPGVVDARVGRREGRPEERLALDRDKLAELGLSARDVARAVESNVAGLEAGRLRRGGREIPIVVRLRPADRLLSADLDGVTLRTPAGGIVPLATLVEKRRGRAPVEIERVDGQRVTAVTAGLESGVALGDTVEAIRADLAGMSLPDGASILFAGEYLEQQAARRDFAVALVMALALVYMLMAAQFERFLDPLIVMLSVPMALVGVVPTLLLTGTTLNLQSVMGLVMLVGIVVNNAIVLVDAINHLRREKRLGAADAVVEAGRLRLRPILMTTTTTVLGLLPLAVGLGPGAEIQAPLARVVIGGLVASTAVTLVLVPVAYTAASGWAARLRAGRWRREEDEPGEAKATA